MGRSVLGREAALRAARFHRDNAESKELRAYWQAVIKGIKENRND
jgi:hypothetical protein